MNNAQKVFIFFLIFVAGIGLYSLRPKDKPATQNNDSVHTARPTEQSFGRVGPISNAQSRVTKKPFGIYITPKSSPVQPEKFTGYHTGTDFETFASEANNDVAFFAICDGKILQKRIATGYGGVMVESCNINDQPVTVIYGHIRANDTTTKAGDNVAQGQKLGYLGQPPTETDGERKHLHLGIHKGPAVNIKGYVQSQSELVDWLDFEKL